MSLEPIGKLSIVSNTLSLARLFKIGEVYEYYAIETREEGCGCGGTKKKEVKFFDILIKDKTYAIPYNNAVQLPDYNEKPKPDFETLRRNRFEETDYSDIQKNCLNCNQQVPHNDLNNLGDTVQDSQNANDRNVV